jgi:adenosylhomocysteine nucleosidase
MRKKGGACSMGEMSARIAIVAALPREIAGLIRGRVADATLLRHGVSLYRLDNTVVVVGGMGAERVTLAVEAALAEGGVGVLVSTGLAGACTAKVRAGDVVEASTVVDAKTGERFETASQVGESVLVTTERIAGVQEKARLASAYGAALVEMEAATVGRLARARGLGFRAIKGVSDAHDFELQALERFAGKNGSFRTGAFAVHTAMRPWNWGKAMELGRGSSQALAGLENTLRALLEG